MILRIALLLASIPLLAHGGEGLFHAFQSRTQAYVTCEQLQRERPRSGWLRVSGCEVDYIRAAYRESGGRITEMFFPLRPAASSPAQPATVILATNDPEVLAIAERTIRGGTEPDQQAFLVMMLQVVTAMRAAREVDGFTRSSLEMLRTRRDLTAITAPLADDVTVLDLHRRPRLLTPAIEVATGAMALLVFTFLSLARQRRAVAKAEPAAVITPTGETEVSPAGARDRTDLRRLMLLNLPDAALASIESAPPLGTQSAVRSAVTRVLPGIKFDESGVGEFNRPDHAIRLDLGRDEQVWTAVVDVTGDAAPAALERLVTQTGWRAYAPRLGRFITREDLG